MTRKRLRADPAVTPELVKQHGLTPEEFERIKRILGREPNFTELGIFSVMWSEHCSYKNSRKELRKFPTTGSNILVKAGEENAGVVDIGDGWAIAFKIESHNHPSAIEPFQGAATGVGGIIRDIFTMGARPEFCLNSLRFGPIDNGGTRSVVSENKQAPTERRPPEDRQKQIAANRRLFTGVVSGIAHYGNCIGIPTIGGEIYFDESFEGNPLVNVFCLGVLRHEQLARGAARGVGNPVFYVGAETAGRGGSGVEIDLAKVPKREPGMTPYEILLSESQERMLIIAKRGKENIVREVFEKWDVPCAEIGRVTADGMMRVRNNGAVAAEIPAKPLAEEAPLYSREAKPPSPNAFGDKTDLFQELSAKSAKSVVESLRELLRDPTIASKNWVYRQYDHTVRTGTLVKPGSDAAVYFVRYANKILAATSDCNSLYCALDPREGAKIAVAEAARNLTCSGAKPLAVTDNLNFGNPYKPENFWQLREAVEGIAEACRVFGTPVTGGNVSLYNESPAGVVDPTATIAMVGLIDDEKHITTQWFKDAGDAIILVGTVGGISAVAGVGEPGSGDLGRASPAGIGDPSHNLGGSHYIKVCYGMKIGPPPHVELELEVMVQNVVRDLIRGGLVKSAHDCSEGGLAVALAECCFNPAGLLGADVNLENCGGSRAGCAGDTPASTEAALFNESQSRIMISVAETNLRRAMSFLRERGIPFEQLGKVGGDELRIQVNDETFRWLVADIYDDWWNAIRRAVESDSAAERIPSL